MDGGEPEAAGLAVQLGVALAMVLVMTIVHGVGLATISRVLRISDDELKERDFNTRTVLLMGAMATTLFMVHLVEIGIFAGFYLAVGAMNELEEALYFSASTYATLGRTEEFFPATWRLLGSLEALIGFLLIGWSTAYIVSKVDKLRRG